MSCCHGNDIPSILDGSVKQVLQVEVRFNPSLSVLCWSSSRGLVRGDWIVLISSGDERSALSDLKSSVCVRVHARVDCLLETEVFWVGNMSGYFTVGRRCHVPQCSELEGRGRSNFLILSWKMSKTFEKNWDEVVEVNNIPAWYTPGTTCRVLVQHIPGTYRVLSLKRSGTLYLPGTRR